MNEQTELAVNRTQIAKALKISLSSLHGALGVIDTDQIPAVVYQPAPGTSIRTVYMLNDVDAFLKRVCSKRYTPDAARHLAVMATRIRVH